MVKNLKGGNKAKGQSRNIKKTIEYDTLEDGQLFGIVSKNLGGHFSVLCSDGITRLGKAINKIKNAKDKRLTAGTCVIISLREFEKDGKNCDIINFAPSYVINSYPFLQTQQKDKNTDIEFNDTIVIKDLNTKEHEDICIDDL
jgi:initiation factor 1A